MDLLPEAVIGAPYEMGRILISGLRQMKSLGDGNVDLGGTTRHPYFLWAFETGIEVRMKTEDCFCEREWEKEKKG